MLYWNMDKSLLRKELNMWVKTVFALPFPPNCLKAKFRKIFYLFKQILSKFSLIRIQLYLSWASSKWVNAKTVNMVCFYSDNRMMVCFNVLNI